MTSKGARSIDIQGKTVQEAIKKGLAILDVSRDQVTIQVLSEEVQGLFGMRGAKQAKIRMATKIS